MTDVVVTSASNTTVISSPVQSTVVTPRELITTVVTGQLGPPGINREVGQLVDVDTSDLQAGSVLVYNTQTSKWTSTTLLNQQQVDCGEF